MNLLLDTCDFLYLATGSSELTLARRQAIEDPANVVFLSAVSAMEIAIKCSIGKLSLPADPEIYVPQARVLHLVAELPLSEQAALHLSALPWHHKDPFDRQLVAQAYVHNLTMVSSDPLIHLYPIHLL